MVLIEGKNWCTKFDHAVDHDLLHGDCPERTQYKGCARCPYTTYKVFKNGVEVPNATEADIMRIAAEDALEE